MTNTAATVIGLLHVFTFEGDEYYVARDEEDALQAAIEFWGCSREDYIPDIEDGNPFHQVPDDATLRVQFNPTDELLPDPLPVGATKELKDEIWIITASYRAWADRMGRGFLCSTEC